MPSNLRRIVLDVEYDRGVIVGGYPVGSPEDWAWSSILHDVPGFKGATVVGSFGVSEENFGKQVKEWI